MNDGNTNLKLIIFSLLYADDLQFEETDPPFILALVLGSNTTQEYTWEYSTQTLKPVRIVTGNQTTSRIEFTCSLLKELGSEKSLPVLLNLLEHNAHNVRWEAARAIFKINFSNGVMALQKLRLDIHPEIRRMSESALNKISENNTSIKIQ